MASRILQLVPDVDERDPVEAPGGGPVLRRQHRVRVIDEHCAHLARLNRRNGTIYQRRRALERLARFLTDGVRGVNDALLGAHLDDLRAFVERDDHSPEYKSAETTHLVGFYRWAELEELRDDNPTDRLERPKRKRGHPRPMRGEHLTRALLEAPSPMREWYYLAAYAGLRACEVAALSGGDDLGSRLVVRDGKGGKAAVVPISPILRAALIGMPREGPWFPHGWDPDRPITAGQLDRRANRWLHEHGIPETFHQLRHWYGTTLRKQGVDLLVIRDLMRHTSVATTEIYTEVGAEEGARAVMALPAPEAA